MTHCVRYGHVKTYCTAQYAMTSQRREMQLGMNGCEGFDKYADLTLLFL